MSSRPYRVLAVDDDEDILELLEYNLLQEGYQVKITDDPLKAIAIAQTFVPHLILLDIMMPQKDGVETCRSLRKLPELDKSFIVFLTARSEEYSEVAAFEAGGDGFIHKPIKPRALMSRIRAILQREHSKNNKEAILVKAKGLVVDKSNYRAVVRDKTITLPKKEFELLFLLSSNPDTVYSREELLRQIWGADVYVLSRTVDVHVRKIREKIGTEFIHTVKGVGYKFGGKV
ncbi:MAG: response regulator transcription factor [Cyclobacteriaceae bacterium]